ncbi:kinase-like domain-containing protein [Gigaspora rosea]|uniref:Kinase-like domain-containing protein n=1 Tax=Gigaspora rosea TaxID=44941 RepID=A0A397VTM3_9GLOM|nr:kinase-like domain-containing protein [Gigaspora rosea]
MSDWFKIAVEREFIKSFEYEFFVNWEIIGEGEIQELKHYMILQFANNGDLRSYFHNHFSELDWPTKIRMAMDIAKGINCLHNANIVHRDLHVKNILVVLVDNGKLMISDFGLSKSLGNSSKPVVGGLCAFCDPKYLQNPFLYKREKPSDIYSLGLTNTGSDDFYIHDSISIGQQFNQLQVVDQNYFSKNYKYERKSIEEIGVSNKLLKTEYDIEILENRAKLYFESGKYDESLINLNRLLDINPNNAITLSDRGLTYYVMGKYNESLTDYNKSLEIDPNNAITLIKRESTYRNMGRYEQCCHLNIWPVNAGHNPRSMAEKGKKLFGRNGQAFV